MALEPKPDGETIKARMISYRRARNMTQRDLASFLGMSPGLVGEMERGLVRSRPAAAKVLALEVG